MRSTIASVSEYGGTVQWDAAAPLAAFVGQEKRARYGEYAKMGYSVDDNDANFRNSLSGGGPESMNAHFRWLSPLPLHFHTQHVSV